MPHVNVTINGKTYRMACEEGQEQHLLSLAQRFDGYVGQLKGAFGEIGDQRLTVMAGILVTDELGEARRRIQSLEADNANLRTSRDELLRVNGDSEAATANRLSALAGRVEEIARKLAPAETKPKAASSGRDGARPAQGKAGGDKSGSDRSGSGQHDTGAGRA
jgi:cell division protein ZapA